MMKEQFLNFFKNQKNFRETILGMLEENVFCSEKWSIFSTEQDWILSKKKKDETKRRRNTEGCSQKEMKKTVKKATEWNTKVLEKERRHGIFWKRNCSTRKERKEQMRRVDKESEHQECTWKDRKQKRVKIRRKKKRENRDKNEKDKNGNSNREFLFSKRNIKNWESKFQEKQEFFLGKMLKKYKEWDKKTNNFWEKMAKW